MAWTTAATWSPDEFPTSTKMNTHIRDNLNALRGAAILKATTPEDGSTAFVTFDSEDFDDNGFFDIGQPTRIVAPWAGRFEIGVHAMWNGGSGSGSGYVAVRSFTSGDVTIDTICEQAFALNEDRSMTGFASLAAGAFFKVEKSFGATGTAGTMTFRAWVMARG